MTLKKAWPTTREAVSFTCCRHSFNLRDGTGVRGGWPGWDPLPKYTHTPLGTRGCSPAVAVAVADGVPAQVAVAVAGGEGVDDVLAVVMVPAAPVGVPVLPCGHGTGCRQGRGQRGGVWVKLGWGWVGLGSGLG